MKLIFFILILALTSCASKTASSPGSVVIDDPKLKFSPSDHSTKEGSVQSEPATNNNDLYDGVRKSVWDDLARF